MQDGKPKSKKNTIMKVKKFIYSLLAAVMMFFVAGCSPDEYSLGEKDLAPEDLAENLAFTISHNADNPNPTLTF